jgi:mRNA interferase MazF
MVGSDYVPRRGDIVWLDFTPQAGHEQAGHRPALVLSPQTYNDKTGLALCCPITSQVKGYPFEVLLPSNNVVTGVVLADQIKSLDWRARWARFACQTTLQVVAEVQGKVDALLR